MINLNDENNRLLDVVNENDEIIDSKPRLEIHSQGLLHREVHVWMFDENKNVFFQKRSIHRPSAGLLDSTAGGHVNKGEDYLDAAVRETKEETGITIAPSDLIFLKKFRVPDLVKDNFGGSINNFVRSVYIYKKPIDEKKLGQEDGMPGGGFQKLSGELLVNLPKEYLKMLHSSILQEIPLVLEYLNK